MNYKTYDIDWDTNNLIWIRKAANQYKMFYYNSVSWFIEDFPEDFRITDLTSSYILNGETWNVAFKKLDWNVISFFKNPETWKYYNTWFYRTSNHITLRATHDSEATTYLYNWETYYVVNDKAELQEKLDEWIDLWHIVTTKVTDMSELFQNNTTFNDEWIRTWDMVNVSNISNMFSWATSFNQDMSHIILFWWMTNVYETNYRNNASAWSNSHNFRFNNIYYADNKVTKKCSSTLADWTYKFNWVDHYVVSTKDQIKAYLWEWDISKAPYIVTSKITDMSSLFYSWNWLGNCWSSRSRYWRTDATWREPNCSNQLNNRTWRRRQWRWCARRNASYYNMFNWNISSWDTSNVTTMENMFFQNHCFNQNISYWDTSKVTNMNNMFVNNMVNSAFAWNISSWNVSHVTAHDWLACNWCTWPAWPS